MPYFVRSPKVRLPALAFFIFGVALVARVPALHQPLWVDEVASARVVTEPDLPAVLRHVRATESTPPLWYVTTWAVREIGAASWNVAALRWLSVLFGAATAVLTFAFAKRFLPVTAAVAAGLVVALTPALVDHGSELRAYALLAVLSIGLAWALVRGAEYPDLRRLAGVALIVALGSLTHYFFLLTVVSALVWVWIFVRQCALKLTFAISIGLLPLVAWLPAFVHQYRHKLYAFIEPFSLRGIAFSIARIFGVFGSSGSVYALGRLLVLFGALIGAWVLLKSQSSANQEASAAPNLNVILGFGPVVIAATLWAAGQHIFLERNLIGTAPFLAVCIAAAPTVLPTPARLALFGVIAAVSIAFYAQFEFSWGRAPYDRLAAVLARDGWHAGNAVVQFGPAPGGVMEPVGWYLPGRPRLARTHAAACARTFVISYDRYAGPAWLRRHSESVASPRAFPAYDHSPRGPRASTPIFVARLDLTSGALLMDAVRHGGHIYTVRGRRCTTR